MYLYTLSYVSICISHTLFCLFINIFLISHTYLHVFLIPFWMIFEIVSEYDMRAQRASEAKRAKRRTCMNFHAWISERVHNAFIFVSNLFICIFVFLIPFPTYLDIFLTPFPMYLHVFLMFFSLYLHLFCIPTYLCIHFLRIYLIHYQNVLKAFSKVFKKWCALPVPLLRQVSSKRYERWFLFII